MTQDKKLRYRGMQVNMLGLPVFDFSKKEKNINKRTPKRIYLRSFNYEHKKNEIKNSLLIYDIPEGKKKERDWFRRQLSNLNFIMIQKSVWLGPSLPRDFVSYLKRIGLLKDFKIFKLAKPYKKQSTL